jgi:hypothetical protein
MAMILNNFASSLVLLILTCASATASSPTPSPTETRGVYGRTAFYETILTDTARGVYSVHGADLDSDGNNDILVGLRDTGTVAWYKNYGNMTFGSITTISNTELGVYDSIAVDVNSDNELDVVVATKYSGKVLWFRNNINASSFTRFEVDSACSGCNAVAGNLKLCF